MSLRQRSPSASRGFSILELLIAMGIFSILGVMAVYLMNRGIDIFQKGTKDAAAQDRLDTVLPFVEEDLQRIKVVGSTDAPALPEVQDTLREPTARPAPLPPVPVRLLCTSVTLRNQPEGPLKDAALQYMGFVMDISAGADPSLAGLPIGVGEEAVPATPATLEARTPATTFLPLGGMVEVAYIAVPEDPARPGVLTLYRGFRGPIGHPTASLLDPTNLDTLAEIRAACRPVATGVLHFGATWRRVFATSWEPETLAQGPGGENTRYVGPRWDSTRGIDKGFALHQGPQSLADPSDDRFPAFVRLSVTIADAGNFGFGRGDTRITNSISDAATRIQIADPAALVRPGLGAIRYLKIGTEWMSYRPVSVDFAAKTVTVQRGARGTKRMAHDVDTQVYVGQPAERELRLPLYRDRFTLPPERGAR